MDFLPGGIPFVKTPLCQCPTTLLVESSSQNLKSFLTHAHTGGWYTHREMSNQKAGDTGLVKLPNPRVEGTTIVIAEVLSEEVTIIPVANRICPSATGHGGQDGLG